MAGMYGIVGGVLKEVSEPGHVMGGVKKSPGGVYVAQGGVQKEIWSGGVPLSSLPVGALIDVDVKPDWQSRFGEKITLKVADQGHAGYPAGCTTLITDRIIQLMCFDAAEPSNSDSSRRSDGNNRYIHSNIHQWLNSNASEGQWYSAKHSYDAPPNDDNVWNNYNEYDQWAGFLAMLNEDFVTALMDTALTVVRPSVDGGGFESFTSKMFLASKTEVGLGNENGIAEGAKLALFSGDTGLAYPTEQAVSNSQVTNINLSVSAGWFWGLRTVYGTYSSMARRLNLSGALNYCLASDGRTGLRPLCNLPGTTKVREAAGGNYQFG